MNTLRLEQFYSSVLNTIGRRREKYLLSLEELRSIDFNKRRVGGSISSKEDMTCGTMLGNIRQRNQELEMRLEQLKEEYARLSNLKNA